MKRFPLVCSLLVTVWLTAKAQTPAPPPLTNPPAASSGLHHESSRPQYHFSAAHGWLNDPNGLIYFGGQYHLFFQHYAPTRKAGPRSWGHAVSPDLLHWTELPEALLPDATGDMWSGSAVADLQNTSGLGTADQPPLALIYTRAPKEDALHGQTSLAFSTDAIHFTKFADNPILPDVKQVNRDPRAFWYASGKHWVLALYVEENDHHNIRFYTSPDLRHWTQASQFQGGKKGSDNFLYECPDIWEMPVEGQPSEKKWILTAGNTVYMVGSFDGKTFTSESPELPGQQGTGYYAPQTFNDEPQGRRVRFGWLQTDAPGMPFTQSMSLPSEHKLIQTPAGLRLTWSPVKELETLRAQAYRQGPLTLAPNAANPLANVDTDLLEIRAEFTPSKTGKTTFTIRGVPIVYDASRGELSIRDHHVSTPLLDGKLDLIIYADRLSLEVYASRGLTYVPLPVDFNPADYSASISVTEEPESFTRLEAYELHGIWSPASNP